MARLVSFVAVCLTLLVLTFVSGCTSPYQEKVVGTWDTDMPGNPKITMAKGGTGSIAVTAMGQTTSKNMTWRLRGSNLIFNIDGKDMGGVIKSADEKRLVLNDPDVKKDFNFTRAN